MKKLSLTLLISIILLFLCPSFSEAQPRTKYNPCDPRYTYGIRPNCVNAAGVIIDTFNDLAKLGAEKELLSELLNQSRQRFFKEYPNGPHRAEAETDFAKLLFQKDMFYLSLAYFLAAKGMEINRENLSKLDSFLGF